MLDNLGELAGAKGPLFWGAAAAAALGASLLAAALALQLRRFRPRSRPAAARPRVRPGGRPGIRLPWFPLRRRPAAPAGAARAVPGGYAPARPALAHSPAPAGTVPGAAMTPDYAPMLARLRRASDRLAAIQPAAADSRLKAGPSRTDQLYREGVG